MVSNFSVMVSKLVGVLLVFCFLVVKKLGKWQIDWLGNFSVDSLQGCLERRLAILLKVLFFLAGSL